MRCGKPSSRALNFAKVPKPIYHFKAYRNKNDVEMVLTCEIEYKMYCDQSMQNEAIIIIGQTCVGFWTSEINKAKQ